MCEWGTEKTIKVIRRNNDRNTDGWHDMAVDACIADYVQVMNYKSILTVGCCCGHGDGRPNVLVSSESIPDMEPMGYDWEPVPGRDDVIVHWIPT
jgi:hypothetical protein